MSTTMHSPIHVPPPVGRLLGRLLTVAAALLLAVAAVAVAAIGLIAPAWAQLLLVVVWVASLERFVAWRGRPGHALAAAVGFWAILVVLIVVGDVWLGWSA